MTGREAGMRARTWVAAGVVLMPALAAADGLIVVGTSGVQHFALPN